jgi:hypothetical protein
MQALASQSPLRLSEAQQLYDGLADPLLRAALVAFFEKQKQDLRESLLNAVRQHQRDTMREARIAGQEEAYSECLRDMQRFAEESLRNASE